MDFFEVVTKRRSIRKFTSDEVPEVQMRKAFEAALLAPNSSNTQTWDFYWVRTATKKEALVKACMSQSAARTAKELVVITANPDLWKRSNQGLIQFIESVNAPKLVQLYYRKLIPWVYYPGPFSLFAPFKFFFTTLIGLFRPIVRGPYSRRDLDEIAIKSAALAAQNFVMAMTAQGFQTCMMEGFDQKRVKKILKLKMHARVVMVVAVGVEGDRGTWGPRYRIPSEQVIHYI